ncbi:MAG: prolipoprotein diacylglyceryl transferase, partial [Clostridiales bacterium]|nr:prolipoprotein diacylglyceryl transferase [Clostridiales bacterium]
MFPDLIPLGNGNAIQSYDVMVVLGIIAAILLYRLLSKRVGLSDKAYNFYLYTSLAAVVFGFVFAAIFDALYKGKFVQLLRYVFSFGKQDSESGLTFYGGLIGGVLTFVVAYFIAKPPVRKEFYKLLLFAPACVLAAHMFGRLGCFLAGCCYGRPGTGFLYFDFYPFDGVTNLGVQLIEALFIGALIYPALRWKKFSAFIYLFGYGLFRFVIEF